MKGTTVTDKKKYWGKLPLSIKLLATAISVIAIVLFALLSEAMSSLPIPIALGGILGYFCGKRCYWWAKEIQSKEVLAFWIGFFFTLLGVLGYYIYLRNKRG